MDTKNNGSKGEEISSYPRDRFFWFGEINKASTVMLKEQDIISEELCAEIAKAVEQVIIDGEKPGAKRTFDYFELEQELIAYGGPEITKVHVGRSRVDMVDVTIPRLEQRDAILDSFEQFILMRKALLEFVKSNPNAIVPFYTQGVPAQPTTLGHYLGGYLEAFSRIADRYLELWERLNKSPFGVAAGGTSSFHLDRERLSELLGFDGVICNSFDAAHAAPLDIGIEVSNVVSTVASTVSMFMTDILLQYTYSKPWIIMDEGVYKQGADSVLKEGELTGTSSMMPQKRNPKALTRVRMLASTVKGSSVTFLMQSHNIIHGLVDYKLEIIDSYPYMPLNAVKLSIEMLELLKKAIGIFVFDEERALKEVTSDYTMITELAVELQKEYDVPFRISHHFASEIVTYGKEHQLVPLEIPYSIAQKLYSDTAKTFKFQIEDLPLSEQDFYSILKPETMVRNAAVLGGPQPSEVERMLGIEEEKILTDLGWLENKRSKLKEAEHKLRTEFENYL